MTALGTWTVIATAVATGFLVARELGEPAVASGVVALLCLVWLVMGVAAARRWRRSGPNAAPRAALVVAALLAVVRGAVAGQPGPSLRDSERGPAAGVRVLRVVRASTPTGRCRILAAPVGRAGRSGSPVLLSVPSELCPLAAGDRIAVPAVELQPRLYARLPGSGSPDRLASSRGAEAVASVGHAWVLGPPRRHGGSWAIAALRQHAWDAARDDDAAAFVVASSLGLRDALSQRRRAELRAAGLGHVIAVSGLHVAVAAWVVGYVLLRLGTLLRRSVAWGFSASVVVVAAYVVLTGAAPPAIRAGAMAILAGWGATLGRPSHGLVLLVATSAVMLLVRPTWIVDPGFQLSVVAMAVLVRSPPGAGLLRTTWRITWAIAPVALLQFGRTGLYAVVSNLVAVPLVTLWTLPLGLVGSLVTPWLGAAALRPAALGARPILDLAEQVATWPEPSSGLLVAMAAGSLAISVALAWPQPALRSLTRARARRVLQAIEIPPLAAGCVLLTIAFTGDPPVPPRFAWVAVGTARQPAWIVAADEPGAACIVGSSLPGERWPRLLDALGVQRVIAIHPERPGWDGAPHLIELREALTRAGRWAPQPTNTCASVERRDAVALLRWCRRLAGPGRVAALVDDAGVQRCFVRGQFVSRGGEAVD